MSPSSSSSSVPPQIIQVKRKRNDDGPVAFLRIEQSTKRHRSGAFLYQRHDPEAAPDYHLGRQTPTVPKIHASRPGEENLPLEIVKRSRAAAATAAVSTGNDAVASVESSTRGKPAGAETASQAGSAAAALTSAAPGTQQLPAPQALPPAARVSIEPRRFHLSRTNSYNLAERHSVLGPRNRVSKVPHPSAALTASTKGSTPALFVERGKRKRASIRRAATEAAALAASRSHHQTAPKSRGSLEERQLSPPSPLGGGGMKLGDQPPAGSPFPKPRLPLQRRRGGGVAAPAASAPKLPDSFLNRWDTDMEQLAREMNEYTLQHLARDLEKIRERDAATAPMRGARASDDAAAGIARVKQLPSSSPLKFKPHPPAKRYAERDPKSAAAATPCLNSNGHSDKVSEGDNADREGNDMEVDLDVDGDAATDSDEDEADYVIDTYVRVAADSVQAEATPDKTGLLILDNEPDMEFFYGQDSESEEEFEDEDDENAENYYAADYPDDEVASDDEFGRNPYAYRTGNASDLEEYGGAGESDDDEQDDGRFKVTIGKPQDLPGLY